MAETVDNHNKAIERLKDDIVIVATLPDKAGIRVLKEIYRRTGYSKRGVAFTKDGGICTQAMLFNEGRRCLWVDLRVLIPKNILKEIEE